MKQWALGAVGITVAVVLLSGCVPRAKKGGSQSVVSGSAPTQSVVSSTSPPESVSSEGSQSESMPPVLETKTVTLGDTIVTERWEFSVQSVNFGNSDGEGNVWFDAYVTVKNLQQQAEDPFSLFDSSIDLELNYNNGYKYGGSTGFEMTYLKPLETRSNIEYSFRCPQEVEDNIDLSLILIITVEGVKYQLVIR